MNRTLRKRTSKEIYAYTEGYHTAINDVIRILNKELKASDTLDIIIRNININLIAIDSIVYDTDDLIKNK